MLLYNALSCGKLFAVIRNWFVSLNDCGPKLQVGCICIDMEWNGVVWEGINCIYDYDCFISSKDFWWIFPK